ncbi:cation:proton antiporter [Methylocystis parvus]|nr:cation:proton antiporter [Methylocystis parvus]WBK00862.1 cation:proton antiporter [Methylocystis parvus OBBP]
MLPVDLSHPVVVLGLVLIFAALFGDAAERLGVPWITGCILAGVVLGPDAIGVLTPQKLSDLGPFLQASLALIAFNIGSKLTGARLKAFGASIGWLALVQLLAPMAAVLAAMAALGLPWPTAQIAAAVSPATAPTTTYAVVRRLGASGPFVDRALGVLAINDAAAILLFSVISSIAVAGLAAQSSAAETWTALAAAGREEALSVVTGATLGAFYLVLRDVIAGGRPGWDDRLRATLYALLLLAVGTALAFGLSHLLTTLAMGAMVANGVGRAEREATQASVGDIEQPLYMIFFVLAGAHLPATDLVGHGAVVMAALVYVLSRVAGKYVAVFLGATALRLDLATRRYLGLCFPSQGGAAMGLVLACNGSQAVRGLSPDAGSQVEMAVSIVLLGVLFSQIFGPIVIDYAVRRGAASSATGGGNA